MLVTKSEVFRKRNASEKKHSQRQSIPASVHRVDGLDIIGTLTTNKEKLGELRVLVAEGLQDAV